MLPFSMKGAVIASGITCLSHTVTLSVCLTSTATKLEPLIWQVRLIFFLVVETLVWKKYSSLRAVNIYQSLLQTEMGNQLLVQLKWRMYWIFSNEVWFVKKWSILKPPWFTMTFRNFQWKKKNNYTANNGASHFWSCCHNLSKSMLVMRITREPFIGNKSTPKVPTNLQLLKLKTNGLYSLYLSIFIFKDSNHDSHIER